MTSDLESLIRDWDGHAVVARHDAPTGAWMFVAIHDPSLGPAVGGTRMRSYPSPAAGLRDAMRLAEAMTWKWASVDMPFGGGKAVLAVPSEPEGEVRDGLLRRYGGLLRSLHGGFSTGEDLGTTPRDMTVVAGAAPYVMGVRHGECRDPGPFTALGVEAGIEAALERALGSSDPAGRTVLIQGVGDVGEPLARSLAARGARVLLADLDGARAEELAGELGGRTVPAAEVASTECDVYAPCAVGGVISAEAVPRLRCRIVAGSANDQLATPGDADRLHGRGILYAPDYVINAGGAIAFGRMHLGDADDEAIRDEVRGIGDTLRSIFREAEEEGETPLLAAHRRARRTLDRAGGAGRPGHEAAATEGPRA